LRLAVAGKDPWSLSVKGSIGRDRANTQGCEKTESCGSAPYADDIVNNGWDGGGDIIPSLLVQLVSAIAADIITELPRPRRG
jgi:hypothetical protein